MRLGVVFPQTEIGSDPSVIRDYAQAAESAGYDHLLVFDHVLGGKLERFDKLGRRPPYTDESPFHEVFVLFGYLGACTQRLELVTGIVILPQRQTALVAKQAAAVDVLTGGRLRLGVGIGWNHVEYEALNEDFHTRGRRVSEQIAVMRKLWTEPVVTFKGLYHHLDRAGINPLPVQRPIPVWMGGMAEPVLKRVAQISDGWFPQFQPGDEASHTLERVRAYMKEAGRPWSTRVPAEAFRRITGEAGFPRELEPFVDGDALSYRCNAELVYRIGRVTASAATRWNLSPLPGGGDASHSVAHGTRADIRLEQSARTGHRRRVFLEPRTDGPCGRSEEHTSELQSLAYLVCRLLLEKKKKVKLPEPTELRQNAEARRHRTAADCN